MDLRSSFMVACVRWILVRMRQKNPLGNGSGRCGKRKVFRRRTSPWPVILTGHYIGGIECGERNVSLVNIQRIADALGVPVKE